MDKESVGGNEPPADESIQEEPVEYDKEKWAELKKGDAHFWALKWGQENNVPQEELESYLTEVVARNREQKKIPWVEFTLRTTLNKVSQSTRWGSPEEIRALGEQVYQEAVEANDLNSQVAIAEVLFGKNSSEYLEAVKRKKEPEAEKEVDEKERVIKIPADATISDLFKAVEILEQQGFEANLDEELHDNFDEDLVEEILNLDSQENKEKVIDFFARFGYSKEDIEAFLPIKFI